MTTRSHRDSLKVQLLDTKRICGLVTDHPLMSAALQKRLCELENKLNSLPLGTKEPKAVLLFSGDPVQGSFGIDANFAGNVLQPFQNMVMADFADRNQGVVGSRGRRFGEAKSRLLLTSLPRGSFGLGLTRADNGELFEEEQLADTLAHVTRLVEAAGRSDEDFAAQLNETAPRVVQNLREFLEVISRGKAGLTLETGDYRCELSPVAANEAYIRVAGTTTQEEPITLQGVFKGILLDSWKYDFVTDDNLSVGGRIDESLTEEQAASFTVDFFNKRCVASLLKTTVLFKNGRARTSYTLKGLNPLSPS